MNRGPTASSRTKYHRRDSPPAGHLQAGRVQIGGYSFGRIEIGGRIYTADVIITPEQVVEGWRRQRGHSLAISDLAEIIAAKPDILVVGTGYYGRMAIPEGTRRYLQAQGLRMQQAYTGKAVAEFNRLQQESARVVAALHLTC